MVIIGDSGSQCLRLLLDHPPEVPQNPLGPSSLPGFQASSLEHPLGSSRTNILPCGELIDELTVGEEAVPVEICVAEELGDLVALQGDAREAGET